MKALPSPENTLSYRLYQYFQLTKPRVVSLIVFCAVIGMFLSVPGAVPPVVLVAATTGIALIAGAAAAVNCLIEQRIDAVMARTRGRPLPRGEGNFRPTLPFSGVIGGVGRGPPFWFCLFYTSPRPRERTLPRLPSSFFRKKNSTI